MKQDQTFIQYTEDLTRTGPLTGNMGSFPSIKIVECSLKCESTRQSKQCGFSIYTFDNLKSKSMVRLVRAEKMVWSGLVFARKIARMILIQYIYYI